MSSSSDNSFSDDMSEYLQAYLDETDEELETLVQQLLTLENDPHDREALNEAFRMLHSLKGSSGMMGFEGIAELAHHLETRFDQFRSGDAELDRPVMNLMLDCLDFFRSFVTQLRAGEDTDQDGTALIERLENIEQDALPEPATAGTSTWTTAPGMMTMGGGYRVRVTFQTGLQLADLKAKLIIARLSNIGEIVGSEPSIDEIQSFDELTQFVALVATDRSPAEVEAIANVDGVESVEIDSSARATPAGEAEEISPPSADDVVVVDQQAATLNDAGLPRVDLDDPTLSDSDDISPVKPASTLHGREYAEIVEEGTAADKRDRAEPLRPPVEPAAAPAADHAPAAPAGTAEPSRQRVSETVRVDIDRLDRLMNLTGELVVTNARFNQIAGRMSPALRSARGFGRMSDLGERLRIAIGRIREIGNRRDGLNGWHAILDEVDEELNALQEQADLWDEGRRHFSQIAEAVDQLTRVSQNLQQGVLDTRMVPVGPLFGRFKRVIRDLSQERQKQVQLIIRGEKTELDKRMIDELGDPLLHLIRNSVDHGLESPADRLRAGKPENGTIVLEASHSGNNVFVTVRDDGAGIDADKVRLRIVERGLADRDIVDSMTDQQMLDYIWHPGFSTADKVTDLSGRGVGMDIVKSRISELNGSIDVSTESGVGTTFRLRLPLTLAIIRSLMIRFRDGFFTIPIDDVREIVSIPADQIYSVHGHRTIDVRGEFIPLTAMDSVFTWHDIDYSYRTQHEHRQDDAESSVVNVVILQSLDKTLGLCVDELLGGADIVIKSLADNFASIRGLSGASIMGDGTVCLMLDTTAVVEMTAEV